MDEEKLYSRIIYKTPNDQDLHQVMRRSPEPKSPRKFKKWSPEISYEERIIRKKRREEEYIGKIYPEERPILLVKKKHVYKNLDGPTLAGEVPEDEKSFKITRNTKLLPDVDEDINENERYIRKFTMVHDKKSPKATKMPEPGKGTVTKVEGIEYLPEGFLELDPLLMKDEFYFDSKVLEKLFLEEQRRVKALRRKQYSEKNYLKKRDVTIYIIDQFKDRIVEFLELWYHKYKRPMRKSELQEVARRLDTPYDNLARLQDLFLKRKKLMMSRKLREYHTHMGKDTARSPSGNRIPESIRDYLKEAGEYDPKNLTKSGKYRRDPNTGKWARSTEGNAQLNKWLGREAKNGYKDNTMPIKQRGRPGFPGSSTAQKKFRRTTPARSDRLSKTGARSYSGNRDLSVSSNQMTKSTDVGKNVRRKSPYNKYNQEVYAGLGTGSFGMGYNYGGGGYFDRYTKSPEYQKKFGYKARSRIQTEKKNSNVRRPTSQSAGSPGRKGTKNLDDLMREAGEIVSQKDNLKNIDSSRVINGTGINPNSTFPQNQMERDRILNEQARLHRAQTGHLNQNQSPNRKNYNSDMKEYLDEEINNLIGKIKGIKDQDENESNKQDDGVMRFKGLKSVSKTKIPSEAVFKDEEEEEKIEKENPEANDEVDSEALLSGGEKDNDEKQVEADAEDQSDIKRRRSQALKDIEERRASQLDHLRNKAGSQAENNRDSEGRNKHNTILGKEIAGQDISESQNESQDEEDPITKKEESEKEDNNNESDNLLNPGRKRGDTIASNISNRSATRSILKRPGEFRKKARTVLFMDKEIIQEYDIDEESNKVRPQRISSLVPVNEEFVRKIPTATIQLTNEQRDKLIEVLEEHQSEEDDIELSLEPTQTETVVRQNLTGDNATVAVNLTEKRGILTEGQKRISVYPRDFFAMVEKQKLKGSRMSVYPADFFLNLDPEGRPMRKSMQEIRNKAVSVYPKDLFDLVEKEIEKGTVSVYPQEMFDFFRDFADVELERPALRVKAASIYPKEFIELAEKQADRENRGKTKSVYPRELFNFAEQEKVDKQRVSVYPVDLFRMLNKEARKRNVSIYPGEFFELLDKEYGDVVKLSDQQIEQVVKMNTGAEETHIVLTSEQRKNMLNTLKEHRAQEEALLSEQRRKNRESMRSKRESKRSRAATQNESQEPVIEPVEITLEPDQVMDILNQNCMIEGAEVELHQDQVNELRRDTKIRPTLIGEEYYDAMVDELVDEFGQRLTLRTLDGETRRSVLKSIGSMKMSVVALDEVRDENKKDEPEVIENVVYDTSKDEIVDINTRKSVKTTRLSQRKRSTIISRLSRISRATRGPRPSVMAGNAYYDALVDELVDKNGRRHTLKEMTLNEVKDIVEQNDAESIPVIVADPNNNKNLLIVDQVDYMPVEDCLVDEKGTKTLLNDLNDEERKSLMKILGSKRGSVYEPNFDHYDFDAIIWGDETEEEKPENKENSDKKEIQFKKKDTVESEEDEDAKRERQKKLKERRITGFQGGLAAARKQAQELDKLKIKEPEKDDDPNRNLENIRNRKGTKYPGKKSLAQLRKEADEKMKEAERRKKRANDLRKKILDGRTSDSNRGSVKGRKSPDSSKQGRGKANTIHPKDRMNWRRKQKSNAGEKADLPEIVDNDFEVVLDTEEETPQSPTSQKRKKNITERRFTKYNKKKNDGSIKRNQTMSGKNKNAPKKGEMEEFAKDYLEKEKAKKRANELRNRKTIKGLKDPQSGKNSVKNRKTISHGKSSGFLSGRGKANTVLGKDFHNKKHDRRKTQKDDLDRLNRKSTKGSNRASMKDRQSMKSRKSGNKNKMQVSEEEETVIEEEEREEDSKPRKSRANTKKGKKFLIDNIYDKNYSNQGQIASGHNIVSEAKDLMDGTETPIEEKEPTEKNEEEDFVDLSEEEKPQSKADSRSTQKKKSIEHDEPAQHYINENINIEIENSEQDVPDLDEIGPSETSSDKKRGKSIKITLNHASEDGRENRKTYHEIFLTDKDLTDADDEILRQKIKDMMAHEKRRLSKEMVAKVEDMIDDKGKHSHLLDEFYEFCKDTLPYDERYKQSVMFVSMFYYFLERKKML